MRLGSWLLLLIVVGGCEGARRPGGATTPSNNRRDASADAATPGDDAAMGGLDALPTGMDASPVNMDAQAGNMDARPVNMDAQPVNMDAAAPLDSGTLDAGPPVNGTIADIRSGFIPFGATVTLRDVVVTALRDEAARPDTIYVQDPRLGASNAGIKVFIRGAHSATRDARVDVTGVVTDYFGETEIDNAVVVSQGTFTALAATPMTIAEAMTEAREGMLVRLTDAFTVTVPYSCSVDNVMCTDLRLWEVHGAGGSIVVWDFLYGDFDWESRQGTTAVTGVMMWRYDRRRILPRTGADLPL